MCFTTNKVDTAIFALLTMFVLTGCSSTEDYPVAPNSMSPNEIRRSDSESLCRIFSSSIYPESTKYLAEFELKSRGRSCFSQVQLAPQSIIDSPPASTPSMVKPVLSIDEAKDKCVAIGFKQATEGFGKCVLQLSK